MVTDAQVRLLRQKRMEAKTQEAAAAAAGMSVRTARSWETGPLPSERKRKRTWRTRVDPFDGVWTREVVALLEADTEGVLEAKTLLEELERRHPGEYGPQHLRTLQRRVRDCRHRPRSGPLPPASPGSTRAHPNEKAGPPKSRGPTPGGVRG